MDWLRSIPAFPDVSTVVVVDGGGTGSRAAVATSGGEVLGYARGGPTNSRSAGDAAAAENLRSVIAGALADAARPLAPTAVLVSSASVDTAAHVEVLASGVRKVVPDPATVSIVADTIGCWAATAALAPAVAVIAGTGSAVLAGVLGQQSRRYGGWDYVLGDEGSGYALGRAGFREVLLVSEGRSDGSFLAEAVRERLGIDETDELFDLVYKPEVDKALIAGFATDVLRLATQGDPRSEALVDEQVRLLAHTVAAALRDFAGIHTLGCFGGIWNVPTFCTRFGRAVVAASGRQPTIVYPGDVAMAGSFRLVLRHGPGGEAGPAEDRAVSRFEAGLVAAKDSPA
ncbi:N-acetylglucosamine kinase [Aquihabitans daechungensis]|uniref:N-acetylglucosamine kinase n=1 Tax=Aquihabitans daechungensis TaxID=1052257 RepID=UPI003BA2D262